jgi:hypothetical protein
MKKVTPKPLNKSMGGTVTSSTARKILDALESMPSVLHVSSYLSLHLDLSGKLRKFKLT